MRKSWLAAVGILALSSPALANDAIGTWLVSKKTAVIKVDTCEAGLCGAIGWAQTPGTDKNNADPTLRTRDIVGMRIFTMKQAGQNKWEGEIYNAEDGRTYKGSVALTGPNSLRIEGCVLLFCGGETWTRTTCDEPPKPAPKKAAAPAAAPFVPLTGCRGVAP